MKDRKIMIARELTKKYETIYRNEVDNIKFFKTNLKGELTIVISKKNNKDKNINISDLKKMAKKYLMKKSLKDTVKLISEKEKVSRRKIYKICLEIKNEKNN